jgi:hypothetical protein
VQRPPTVDDCAHHYDPTHHVKSNNTNFRFGCVVANQGISDAAIKTAKPKQHNRSQAHTAHVQLAPQKSVSGHRVDSESGSHMHCDSAVDDGLRTLTPSVSPSRRKLRRRSETDFREAQHSQTSTENRSPFGSFGLGEWDWAWVAPIPPDCFPIWALIVRCVR